MQTKFPALPLRLHELSARLRALILPLALMLNACETPPKPSVFKPSPVNAGPRSAPAENPALPAQSTALRELVALQDKLYRVTAPLLVHNPRLCPRNTRDLLGFSAKNKYSYSSEFIDSAQKLLGLDDQLQIMGVMAGSGAAGAGIRIGDRLVAINGTPIPQGQNAEHIASLALVSLIGERTSISLTIDRLGKDLSLNIPLTHACAFVVELGNTDKFSAYNDGHRVLITRGMMKALDTDEQLAYMLATEMAHNALMHAKTRHMSAATADIIDNLTQLRPDPNKMGNNATPKLSTPELDIAADRLALYMLARAGFEIAHAGQFWARLAAQHPSAEPDSYNAIHPVSANRLSSIARVTAEIAAKQAANKPLTP